MGLTLGSEPGMMEPHAPPVKLEVLEALAQVKTEQLPQHAGPPHAHEDAVSSLGGLVLSGPSVLG